MKLHQPVHLLLGNIGLTKKFVQVFCTILQKNPNKLFDESNIIVVEAEHLRRVFLAQVMDMGGRTLPANGFSPKQKEG